MGPAQRPPAPWLRRWCWAWPPACRMAIACPAPAARPQSLPACRCSAPHRWEPEWRWRSGGVEDRAGKRRRERRLKIKDQDQRTKALAPTQACRGTCPCLPCWRRSSPSPGPPSAGTRRPARGRPGGWRGHDEWGRERCQSLLDDWITHRVRQQIVDDALDNPRRMLCEVAVRPHLRI